MLTPSDKGTKCRGTRFAYVQQMNKVASVKGRSGILGSLSVGEAVAEATGRLSRGEDEGALTLLEEVVRHEPRVPVFRYLLGVAQFRQKLYEPAISNFEKARGKEHNIDYLVALCGALMAERPLDALTRLARAVQLGSKQAAGLQRLADLLLDAQKADDALRVCDSGLNTCGDDPTIIESRGRALRALARCEEALECLRKAEALLPQDLATMIDSGRCTARTWGACRRRGVIWSAPAPRSRQRGGALQPRDRAVAGGQLPGRLSRI